MEPQMQSRAINKVIAKAWMDEGFKKKLLSNPTASLKEEGVEVPQGVEFRIAGDTAGLRHLVLPPKPSAGEVSEEMITKVAGGTCECGPCAPTNYQCGGGTYNCASGFCTGGGWCGF